LVGALDRPDLLSTSLARRPRFETSTRRASSGYIQLLRGVAFLERETRLSRAISADLPSIQFSYPLAEVA